MPGGAPLDPRTVPLTGVAAALTAIFAPLTAHLYRTRG